MKDEIKEILDDLDYAINRQRGTITLNQKDIKALLDYIINLQEEKDKEIERLNNIINNIHDDLEKTLEMNNKFKDNYGNELLNIDINHMKYLISMLELKEKSDKK